ncbi:hypothetical protein CRG98_047518, partial [Punica granatum]
MSLKIIAPPEKTSLTTKGPSYLSRESSVICRTFRRTSLHCTVHLGTVWSRVAVMHFESLTKLVNDPVVQVLGIVSDDRLVDSVSGDDVTLEKTCHGICSDY